MNLTPHSIDAERARHPVYKHVCYWGVILNEDKQPIFRIGTYRKKGDAMQAAMTELLNRANADERTIAERKWLAPIKPAKAQQPCDHGLFSDEMDQVEMFMDPTNE